MANDLTEPAAERKRRGNYAVSARLAKVLTLLVSGECKTQKGACAAAGYTPRALQAALRKSSVKSYMQEVVMTSLGVSAMKAAKRIDDLLHSPNEMVAFNSSRYALATGLQIAPPERSGATVNVGIVGAGFILDLREDVSAPLPRPPGLVIEGEAVELEPRPPASS